MLPNNYSGTFAQMTPPSEDTIKDSQWKIDFIKRVEDASKKFALIWLDIASAIDLTEVNKEKYLDVIDNELGTVFQGWIADINKVYKKKLEILAKDMEKLEHLEFQLGLDPSVNNENAYKDIPVNQIRSLVRAKIQTLQIEVDKKARKKFANRKQEIQRLINESEESKEGTLLLEFFDLDVSDDSTITDEHFLKLDRIYEELSATLTPKIKTLKIQSEDKAINKEKKKESTATTKIPIASTSRRTVVTPIREVEKKISGQAQTRNPQFSKKATSILPKFTIGQTTPTTKLNSKPSRSGVNLLEKDGEESLTDYRDFEKDVKIKSVPRSSSLSKH